MRLETTHAIRICQVLCVRVEFRLGRIRVLLARFSVRLVETRIMTRTKFDLLIVAAIAGCSGCADGGATTSADSPVSVSPASTANFVAPEPVPFESIALASDSSYASPPLGDGAEPGEVRELTRLKIKFCWCPAGKFRMGSSDDTPGHLLNETQFDVTFSRGF